MAESQSKRAKETSSIGSLQKGLSIKQQHESDTSTRFLMANPLVCSMLTDFYQLTMAYAYWRSGKHNEHAVFDLFFRKNPFGGEFTIFAGVEDCIRFLKNFKYTDGDIAFLKTKYPPETEPEFFEYLKSLNGKNISLYAIDEGSVVFPRVPMLRVEGPLGAVQLLETTLLTLVNFASLVTTNAARYRLAAGDDKTLLEFGLRRAQGPDGGMTASKYTYLGGFDATSNVLAGKMYGVPIAGTHAHAFVSSYRSFDEIQNKCLKRDGKVICEDFTKVVEKHRENIAGLLHGIDPNQGELASFTAYALSFPNKFTALVDTYDVLKSGAPNFCAVALALHEFDYIAQGVRLDSGDLAYLSLSCRDIFMKVAAEFNTPSVGRSIIVASNDINESTLLSLKGQPHSIDSFGIGTHLVTCQSQPALGAVYKLVELNKEARMKLSADVSKVTIPSRKDAYRLFGSDGKAICDIIQLSDEQPPKTGEKILCRHPFEESKRANVSPKDVQPLLNLVLKDGELQRELPSLEGLRERVRNHLKTIREDHKRSLNPTPYKVSVSDELYTFMHKLWIESAPIGELS